MKTARLIEILAGASLLVGATGCPCPDGHVEEEARIARTLYAAQLKVCLDSDDACVPLCRAAFELPAEIAISRCVIREITGETALVATTYHEPVSCVGGRRPNGFTAARRRSRAIGDWLAQIATVEAASVTAFARLVRALERFGAPGRLIAATRSAILDEVIHARLTARLAWRRGARVDAPVIAPAPEPTLAELAHENAVEGQIAETFGALLAMCQAQLARDPEVRGVFALIARDEARHAALAHELAGWFEPRLDAAARVAVAAARRHAACVLIESFDAGLDAPDRAELGIPEAAQLRAAAAHTFALTI